MSFARRLRIGWQRLRSVLRPHAVDTELERELAFHVDALVAEKIAGGLSETEARRAAARTVGDLTRISEACRDTRRVGWIADARQDLIYGARLLRSQPGLAITAVLSLGLGIGVTVAALRGVDAALAGVLRLPDGDRHVLIQTVSPAKDIKGASAIEFTAWRNRSDAFDLLAASMQSNHTAAAEPGGPAAERLRGLIISPEFFESIGVRPMIGRPFTRQESRLVDPSPAAIISEQLWRERYGADPEILSRTIRLDGRVRPIIGVMPADVRYRDAPIDVWSPLHLLPTVEHGSGHALRVYARLKPGVGVSSAETQLNAIAGSLAGEFPGFSGWSVVVRPFNRARLGWSYQPLAILTAIAMLVLIAACANVAGLQLARAAARQREIGLRLDLGATRGRLFRQWLAEGVLLGLLGGAAGLGVAVIGLRSLVLLSPPPGAPPLAPLTLDWRTTAIAVVVSLAAGIALSLAPALNASRIRIGLRRSLPAWPRTQSAVVSLQLAVTVIVVVGSGLLASSLVRLSAHDLGFDPNGLLTFDVAVPVSRTPLGLYENRQYFEVTSRPAETIGRFERELHELPNVISAGASSFRAIDAFTIPRFDVSSADRTLSQTACAFVTGGYFSTLGAPIVVGRAIERTDDASAGWVAVVNETAAARLWPGEDPIGKTLRVDTVPDDRPRTVVGVVRDIPLGNGAVTAEPVVYESNLQQPARFAAPWINLFGTMTFVVRYRGSAQAMAADLRRTAARIEPDVPLAGLGLVTDKLAAGRARLTGLTRLALLLAATGIALALVGIHGVVAYGIRRRTPEIAVRKALGARPLQIVRFVGAQVAPMVVIGLVTGLLAAMPLGHFLDAQLWGVTPTDPLTYAIACLVIASVAVLACLAPTRRAVDVDPTVALRME